MANQQQAGLDIYRQQAGNQRDQLIQQCLPMVKKIALHMASFLSSEISRDDLIQAGMIGLIEAASRYDPSRNIPFEQFAKVRIRGAVIDELRQWDWRSRSDREHGHHIKKVISKLQGTLDRAPSEKEIAAELGVSVERYHRMLLGNNAGSLISLDVLMQKDVNVIEVSDDDSVEVVAMGGEQKKALMQALKTLPEREQQLLNLYYVHELNMKEVAQALELTEARISQLHRQAVLRLRALLDEWNRTL